MEFILPKNLINQGNYYLDFGIKNDEKVVNSWENLLSFKIEMEIEDNHWYKNAPVIIGPIGICKIIKNE